MQVATRGFGRGERPDSHLGERQILRCPGDPSDAAEPRSHRGGPLVTGLRALLAIAVFLSVVDNEFGLTGAVAGGSVCCRA